ncbi:adenosylcobinamide amidohydrolase [Pararhodospirillum photometricum]|nr:adenosylcobinamide amidohydrolase [Pararhodospirillum photometricum]
MMILARFEDTLTVERLGKILALRLLVPHRVLSTGAVKGGLEDGVGLVFNHQGCEPVGHFVPGLETLGTAPEAYQEGLLARHGLADAGPATGMVTAANMNAFGMACHREGALAVLALATGGVDGNAARAGDPASLVEDETGFHPRTGSGDASPRPGTINLMLAVNRPLTPGALVRAVMMATEAKVAALQELSIPSRLSATLATGTGTDQMVVVAPERPGYALSAAGHGMVLGELIARATAEALRETLARQNHLTPVRQGAVGRLLERFGLAPGTLALRVGQHLTAEQAEVFRANSEVLERDPPTVAAVLALIHAHDQGQWGVVASTAWPVIALALGASVACALSGRIERWPAYHSALAAGEALDLVGVIGRAMALGFADKWSS